jgi:type IV secretory pathway VirB6-like protein
MALRNKFINKIFKLTLLFFLLINITSCGSGCVESDEFDFEESTVDANPTGDGIYGTYDDVTGGQMAEWHSTGLKSDGKPFLLQVTGGWVPWYGGEFDKNSLAALRSCYSYKDENNRNQYGFCAKNSASNNCICYKKQVSEAEIGIDGKSTQNDCSDAAKITVGGVETYNQNDPEKCTCTSILPKTTGGYWKALDYGVYHFPLDIYKKNHIKKLADEADFCKYDRGMGLYLGLFGQGGVQYPTRAYHLFSETAVCSIAKNSNGECIDEDGIDRTKYIFRSANTKPTVRDDKSNNDGSDVNTSDDENHQPGESIKLIIHDRYYSDNYGEYKITFLGGVIRAGDDGLLEFIARTIENSLLGETESDGHRKKGIVEFMFKALVQDTHFAALITWSLALYIAFYGVASLIGIVEINKKELLGRLFKIGMVMFFTNPASWEFYNSIVVKFFKEGMDFLVVMFGELAVSQVDDETLSSIRISESLGQIGQDSNASRFSYIDTMIKSLFSLNVTKKIWGLAFESIFGIIYIIAIYALILFFIYVMLTALTAYALALVKIIFALSLGPIFFAFLLFSQTSSMLNKWIAFLGGKALEIVILFMILYIFIALIDQKFTNMLSYRVCADYIRLGLFSIPYLKAYSHRSFLDWMNILLVLTALIFILKMIMDQIPEIAAKLIVIGGESPGQSDGDYDGGKGLKFGSNMMADLKTGIGMGVSAAFATGGAAFRGARYASRASGLSGLIDKVGEKIPFRGAKTRSRDGKIDDSIGKARKEGKALGLGGVELDKHIRNKVMEDMAKYKSDNPNKSALLDFTSANIQKRLDAKLIDEPLQKAIKDIAKELKKADSGDIKLGKDMSDEINKRTRDWADKNLSGGSGAIKDKLTGLKSLVEKEGALSSSEAAKKFAGDQENQNRYLQHLKGEQFKHKGDGTASKMWHGIKGDTENNPKRTQQNFSPKLRKEEDGILSWREMNDTPGHRARGRNDEIEADRKAVRTFLTEGSSDAEKAKASNHYNSELASLDKSTSAFRKMEKERDGEFDKIGEKRSFFKQELKDHTTEALQSAIQAEVNSRLDPNDPNNNGKTTDEVKREVIDEFMKTSQKEFDDMKKQHIAAMQSATANDIKKLQTSYQDGLLDIDGNSLFESKARLDYMKSRYGGKHDVDVARTDDEEKAKEKSFEQEMQERSKELSDKFDEAMKLDDLEALRAAKDEIKSGDNLLTNNELQVEMGASIEDALIKEVDIGLKAGNPLLTAGDSRDDAENSVLVSAFNMEKTDLQNKTKMHKLDKRIKEMELYQEESKDDDVRDDVLVKSLKEGIKQFDKDIAYLERQESVVDSKINAVI